MFALNGVSFSLVEVLVWLIVAAICGGIAEALVGYSPGGLLVSIAVGTIGAFLGSWLAHLLGLPAVLVFAFGGTSIELLWTILGAIVLVGLISLLKAAAASLPACIEDRGEGIGVRGQGRGAVTCHLSPGIMRRMAAPGTTHTAHTARAAWRSRRVPAYLAPLLVFGLTLSLYLATLTGVHTFDALSYILDVQRKPWRELFHPHHLAYGPLGWASYHGALVLGYAGPASLPLQVVNALAGAAGVALFYASLRRITGQSSIALACAALLALSYAFWYYAVEVEVYTLAALFLIACLDQLARLLRHPSRRGFALLGLLQGLAVLFHQTNVLLCVPVVAALLVGYRSQVTGYREGTLLFLWRNARSQQAKKSTFPVPCPLSPVLSYAAALALTVGMPYLFVAAISGLTSWARLRDWLLSYAETGWWGGPITADKWQRLGEGLSLTIADRGGALLGLLLLGLAVLYSRHLLRLPASAPPRAPYPASASARAAAPLPARLCSKLALVCLVWLITYGAFFLWWEPDNIEFWIASLPPALLLLALALRVGEGAQRWRPGLWLTLACALTMAAINGEAIALRGDPARDLQRQIVAALVAASAPDDLLLVPDGLQELYLPFYAGRFTAYSWNQAFYEHGPAWPAVCGAVQSRIDAALYAGAAVLVADDVLEPPALLMRRHRFAQADVAACLMPYRQALTPVAMPAPQPPAQRIAGASEVAAGEGWRFEAFGWGWQGANIADQRFDGGWRFLPGRDPALISPRLLLRAEAFRSIEIVLSSAGTGEAQLFWAHADGALAEAQSIRWPLRAGRHTYRLALEGRPGWQGIITGLRLDPVPVGDGRPLRLIALRLVP